MHFATKDLVNKILIIANSTPLSTTKEANLAIKGFMKSKH
jgi:hypothetical protein